MSISHIEDSTPSIVVDIIDNIEKYTITEKVDGANLTVGVTDMLGLNTGRISPVLYTSRTGKRKNAQLYFKPEDYELTSANVGFINAHKAIEAKSEIFTKFLKFGDSVEIEVLNGKQPNAIEYGDNRIVFLKAASGNPDISGLIEELSNVSVLVDHLTVNPFGVKLEVDTTKEHWFFSGVPACSADLFQNIKHSDIFNEYKDFLNHTNDILPNQTNLQVIETSLNKVSHADRPLVKEAREHARTVDVEYKSKIKELLVSSVLQRIKPQFQHSDSSALKGIEGIVITSKETGRMVKVVDKHHFTNVNEFNFHIRNDIKSPSPRRKKIRFLANMEHDLFSDFVEQQAKILFGNENIVIGHYTKFPEFTSTHETKVFASDIHHELQQLLKNQHERLLEIMATYLRYKDELGIVTNTQNIGITDEVHRRTMIVYREVQEILETLQTVIAHEYTVRDYVLWLKHFCSRPVIIA